MLIKDLTDFGLNEKEAKTYLSLLKLEIAGVQEIARATGVNRSTTYVILESLMKRGLASISDDKNVRQYVATSPEMLLRSAEESAKKFENIRKKIEALVPELNALHKDTRQRPKVRIFEGREGLMSAFEDTLGSQEKIMRVSSSVGTLFQLMPDYFIGYVKRRIKAGIKMKSIHPYDEVAKNLVGQGLTKFDQPIFIPKEKYKFPADLAIYDNKIGYMSLEKGGMAIVIESKEMSDVMKSVFDLAWEEAKRLNKNVKIS